MRMLRNLINLLFIYLFLAAPVFADTIHLINGYTLEGFIKDETGSMLYLDIGCGTVGFLKTEIKRVSRSSPKESRALIQKWELEKQKRAADDSRLIEQKRSAGAIPVLQYNGHMLVDVMINNKVKVPLLVDTGASIVVLSGQAAKQLNLKPMDDKMTAKLQMADGRKVEAKAVILESVRLQDIEEKNVEAAVMPDDVSPAGSHQGLLGMSFLNRFKFSLDYKNNRLILKK